MSKMNALLSERLKSPSQTSNKMNALAERSSSGNLSSFSGVFKVSTLSEKEQDYLKNFLEEYKEESCNLSQDFLQLSSLTSEVKAITSQAVILHGERIKKAQEILKGYKEGAFTCWLISTYGNRQTPYNFLQYFELHQQLPGPLVPKLGEIPRQAAYTLASRAGSFSVKQEIIENYKGESKAELLEYIRKTFPLSKKDKRGQDLGLSLFKSLQRISDFLKENGTSLPPDQKKKAKDLLKDIQDQLS